MTVKPKLRLVKGLGMCRQEYQMNGVTYIVSSRFEKLDAGKPITTVSDRIQRTILNSKNILTLHLASGIMQSEYVCSAATEEAQV